MTNPADIPQPLPWEQRARGVGSMPGGYSGYIHTLRHICQHVVGERPSSSDLASWIHKHFELSKGSVRWRVNFLKKAGVLEPAGNQLHLSDCASRWYATSDDGILIGLLHSRLQFFGEMLAELCVEPRSFEELRQAAKKYGISWDSDNQGHRRRGWLESAMLIEPAGTNRIAITNAGRDLLAILTLHKPDDESEEACEQSSPATSAIVRHGSEESSPQTGSPDIDQPAATSAPSPAQALADEIREASTDSKNPERLELAIRDTFQFLGFDAEKLGGSGKTDVLVGAPLGGEDSYSVTIDAKTVGSGSLGDGQVDWVTLDDHRKQHNADYSMLIGPNPSGSRLMNRAVTKTVAVLSTEQLADLCIQHATAPLGLETYRALFNTGGAVDTSPIEEEAKSLTRLRDLAAEICVNLAERTKTVGPIGASQLQMVLGHSTDKSEIQQVLDTLASPLLGAIQGTADKGYVLATAPRVIQQRLQQLGDQLAR